MVIWYEHEDDLIYINFIYLNKNEDYYLKQLTLSYLLIFLGKTGNIGHCFLKNG